MKLGALANYAGLARAAFPNSSTSTVDSSPSALSTTVPTLATIPALQNANHVFNAVRGAMRQWDSSWNHNGMSFFLATVPKDIQFYHGRSTNGSVTGMEWPAFEPEHALLFAHDRPQHPLGEGPGGPPHKKHEGRDGQDDHRSRQRGFARILGINTF